MEVLNRIETRGRATDQEDTQIVTELVDDIRDIVTDYQVSGDCKLLLPPCLQSQSRRRTSRPYTIRTSS